MDQGSSENHSAVSNFAPTVTKLCVMWEGQALPHDTKFGNCRDKIVDSRAFLSWSLIHGSSWSGLIKLGPGHEQPCCRLNSPGILQSGHQGDCHYSGLSWWRHQMETFSALPALCAGNSPVPVNSPHKGQWRGALMFSLICTWINDWVNNREAGDLRRHRAHHDVTVMRAWTAGI